MNAEESRITADPAQARLPSRRRSMSACRRHPEPCREKVPRPLRPISAPPRPDIYRRGSRRLGGESSKHWEKKFQGLEILEEKVPRFGSFQTKSSKVWKFWKQKFQGLEISVQKVPSIGRKSSKLWKSCREKFQALKVQSQQLSEFVPRSASPVPAAASIRRSRRSRHNGESPPRRRKAGWLMVQ